MGVLVYRSCSASISLLLISNRKKSSLISWGNIWAQRLNPPLSCLFISSCLHVKSLCEPDVVKGALKCFPCDVFVLASPMKKKVDCWSLRPWDDLATTPRSWMGCLSCSLRSLDEISQLLLFLPVHPPTPPHWRPSETLKEGSWERMKLVAWIILT